jgi:hypothetical protein
MIRERTLRILLVLVALTRLAGLYPLLTSLPRAWSSGVSIGDQIILSIDITLGVFQLLAVRNPSAHRSLIAFTGWSSLAHDSVMIVQSSQARPFAQTSCPTE